MREMVEGEQLEVGDLLEHRDALRTAKYPIARVTQKYAFVRYNDISEGKFKRVIGCFGPLPTVRYQWDTSTWHAFTERTK